jgi:hypothetical protein
MQGAKSLRVMNLLAMAAAAALLLSGAAVGPPAEDVQQRRAAILFCSPHGVLRTTNGWLDLALLRLMHNGSWASFEVDWTETLDDMNQTRLFKYNAVVLFKSPNSLDSFPAYSNSTRHNFMPLMTKYMQAGGGVLIYPSAAVHVVDHSWRC